MLYIFGFLSLFSPVIFLQSRLLDSPLAPTIGAQTVCLLRVCLVSPSPGTTLQAFARLIPSSDLPRIGGGPRAMIQQHVNGDGVGGHSERRVEARRYAPPFYIASSQTPPSGEMLSTGFSPSTDRMKDNETGATSGGSLSRLFPVTPAGFADSSSSTSRSLPLPQCMRSDKVRYIRNLTCPYLVFSNGVGGLPAILSSAPTTIVSRPFVEPRCLMSDKARHLLNQTCSTPAVFLPPLAKAVVYSRPVFGHRCLASEKSLHLLNETCVLVTSMNQASERIAEAETAMFNTTPYRPMSIYSLPCLPSGKARRAGTGTCGYNTPPTLATVLDWDIGSQAALLAFQTVKQAPVLLTDSSPSEPQMCRRRRDPNLFAGICSIATGLEPLLPSLSGSPATPKRKRSTMVVNSPRLRAIRMVPIVIAILSVLGRLFGGMKRIEQLEGDIERLCAAHKVEVALTEVVLAETVGIVVSNDDAPPVLKTNTSPIKAKCRIVAGRRVKPIQKSKTSPTPPITTPTQESAKKRRKAKAPRP